MRNLSVKSAQAAKNSADMLRDTQIKAQLGSAIAGETAQSLDNIVAGINQSAALMEEISRFNVKQAEAVTQITLSTRNINESVQSTSTLAEETSSASQVMSAQADLLKKLVGSFRLRDQESGAPAQDRKGAESRGLSLHP